MCFLGVDMIGLLTLTFYYQKNVLKEIIMHAQYIITTLGSIITIMNTHLYEHLMSTRIFILIKNTIFI